jgi:hypothetical protein
MISKYNFIEASEKLTIRHHKLYALKYLETVCALGKKINTVGLP